MGDLREINFNKINGFVLECDASGAILSVLSDPVDIISSTGNTKHFFDIADSHEKQKSELFIEELNDKGSVHEWQINTCYYSGIEPFYYAGKKRGERLIIMGARFRGELSLICLEYFLNSSEHSSEYVSFMKKVIACENCVTRKADQLYNEISSLNNELSNMYREITRKNSELEHLHEIKNKFLGMAAHDMRNPLLSIDAFTGFLDEELREQTSEDQKMFLSRIRKNVDHMVNIINDFLNISSIESGKLNLNLNESSINELLTDCIYAMKPIAARMNKTITFEADDSIPEILLDESKITQVFENIIGNAITYTHDGDNIIVKSRMGENGSAVISIKDHGPGMTPEVSAKIFEFYERGAASRTKKGSGLGLAIAKSIVDGHEGRISVESEPEKGTTFFVVLPINRK